MKYNHYVIHFTDKQVIWCYNPLYLIGIDHRHMPFPVRRLNALFTDTNELRMSCTEEQLASASLMLFDSKALWNCVPLYPVK